MSDITKTLERLRVATESAHRLISVASLFFSDRLELPVSSWSGSSPTASTPDWRPSKSWPSCRQTPPSPQSSSTWRASGRWRVWWRAAPSELDRLHVPVPVLQHPVTGSAGVKAVVWFPCSFGEMLAFTLTAFLELMDHGIVSWDLISLSFIKQVPPFY